jgi:hypothetical protein
VHLVSGGLDGVAHCGLGLGQVLANRVGQVRHLLAYIRIGHDALRLSLELVEASPAGPGPEDVTDADAYGGGQDSTNLHGCSLLR